jgi:hypothetical protein
MHKCTLLVHVDKSILQVRISKEEFIERMTCEWLSRPLFPSTTFSGGQQHQLGSLVYDRSLALLG